MARLMWDLRRFALTAIIIITPTLARPTASTAPNGLWTAHSLALDLGITGIGVILAGTDAVSTVGVSAAVGTVTASEAGDSSMKDLAAADSEAGKGFMAVMDSAVVETSVEAADSMEVVDSTAAVGFMGVADTADTGN